MSNVYIGMAWFWFQEGRFWKQSFNKCWSVVWKLSTLTQMAEGNPVGQGLVCIIATSHIFQLRHAIKIFSKRAVGLNTNKSFLNPHWKYGCTHVGWISSHLAQAHPSYCFAVLQTGGRALSTSGLWSRPLGNPIMFAINQNKLASCSVMSSYCPVCLVWNGRKSSMDWGFW